MNKIAFDHRNKCAQRNVIKSAEEMIETKKKQMKQSIMERTCCNHRISNRFECANKLGGGGCDGGWGPWAILRVLAARYSSNVSCQLRVLGPYPTTKRAGGRATNILRLSTTKGAGGRATNLQARHLEEPQHSKHPMLQALEQNVMLVQFNPKLNKLDVYID